MNLFWLCLDFALNASYHCDQHVVKMPLEAVQVLYAVLWLLDPNGSWRDNAPYNKQKTARGYKLTHKNHPLVKWATESLTNYMHCADYALALCREYTIRYKKTTLVEEHAKWLKNNPPATLFDIGMTPVPLCIGEDTTRREEDLEKVVAAYRMYYKTQKLKLARYRHTEKPEWLLALEFIDLTI